MIFRSNSIEKKEEKQSRFTLLPLMNEDQIDRLRDILIKEKTKIAEIEAKYSVQSAKLWSDYATKREESQYISKMEVIKKAEAQHNVQEHQEADALLQNL